MQLEQIAIQIHEENKKKGFWPPDRCIFEVIALILSEMVEALEALRKDRKTAFDLQINESDPAFESVFINHIKDSFEDEIADTCIRILDLAGAYQLELPFVWPEKVQEKWLEGLQNNLVFKSLEDSFAKYLMEFSIRLGEISKQIQLMNQANEVLQKYLPVLLLDLLNYAILGQIDIQKHVEMKLAFNRRRAFMHNKKF